LKAAAETVCRSEAGRLFQTHGPWRRYRPTIQNYGLRTVRTRLRYDNARKSTV